MRALPKKFIGAMIAVQPLPGAPLYGGDDERIISQALSDAVAYLEAVFALDAKTGALKWEHKVGVGVVNTVVPLSANRVLATDFDGRVRLVETKE
jgi:outer membrane protein assembly factor BamB